MTKYTNAEMTRLRNAVLEKVYPLALKHRLSPAQLEDVTQRIVASGKVFLTADDKITGYEIEFLIDELRSDPRKAHLFRPASEDPKAQSDEFQTRFGMSKAEFDKLTPRQRLEKANEELANAETPKRKRG